MTTILDLIQDAVTTEVRLFGHPADLSDPDNPAFEYRGRTYHVVECKPYVTKAGGETQLLTLQATCAHCGETFEYDTGVRTVALYANCEDHRRNHGGRRKAQPAASQPDWQATLANATLSQRAAR